MCSKCPPWALTQAERRRRHWLMAATTIDWCSFLHSTNGLCFSSARRHHYVSCIKGITQASVEMQLYSCFLSQLGKESYKFYTISSVLIKLQLWQNSLSQFFGGHSSLIHRESKKTAPIISTVTLASIIDTSVICYHSLSLWANRPRPMYRYFATFHLLWVRLRVFLRPFFTFEIIGEK